MVQARFHTDRLFRVIDLDGDGVLSESEFIGVRQKIMEIRLLTLVLGLYSRQ